MQPALASRPPSLGMQGAHQPAKNKSNGSSIKTGVQIYRSYATTQAYYYQTATLQRKSCARQA